MPSCRPTHTHTHPPCHLAARHRSEPCPPAPASRCTATLHFRCPAAVLMRKPAPERKPELKPGPDPPYGNAPPDRTFRRASTPVNNSRRSPPPTHTSAPPPDTSFPGSSPPDTAPQLHSAPKRASTPVNNSRRSPPPTHTSAPPPDTSFPGSSPPDTAPQLHSAPKRASTPASSPATSPPDTPSHSNTPRNRRFRRAFPSAHGARHHRPTPHHRTARRAFPPAHNRRRTHSPTHSLAHIRPGTRIRPRNAHPRRPRRPALPLRPVDARAHKKAKHPCGCFASLWKRGVRYSPRAKRL